MVFGSAIIFPHKKTSRHPVGGYRYELIFHKNGCAARLAQKPIPQTRTYRTEHTHKSGNTRALSPLFSAHAEDDDSAPGASEITVDKARLKAYKCLRL
ncbi:hypothetical protein [Entomobacter blattae]|uniref:hypothetical protein n=1 Tax=Entomobacter blattae TaxID=2762277 RepID=UPI00193AFE1E|nr:hypothetical protein [Entomobacter blattae]